MIIKLYLTKFFHEKYLSIKFGTYCETEDKKIKL